MIRLDKVSKCFAAGTLAITNVTLHVEAERTPA
jgi:hypothetical protein